MQNYVQISICEFTHTWEAWTSAQVRGGWRGILGFQRDVRSPAKFCSKCRVVSRGGSPWRSGRLEEEKRQHWEPRRYLWHYWATFYLRAQCLTNLFQEFASNYVIVAILRWSALLKVMAFCSLNLQVFQDPCLSRHQLVGEVFNANPDWSLHW